MFFKTVPIEISADFMNLWLNDLSILFSLFSRKKSVTKAKKPYFTDKIRISVHPMNWFVKRKKLNPKNSNLFIYLNYVQHNSKVALPFVNSFLFLAKFWTFNLRKGSAKFFIYYQWICNNQHFLHTCLRSECILFFGKFYIEMKSWFKEPASNEYNNWQVSVGYSAMYHVS